MESTRRFRYDLKPVSGLGAFAVDETITSFLMLVALGTAVGVVLGGISMFFAVVLWKNIEEVPEDSEADSEQAN